MDMRREFDATTSPRERSRLKSRQNRLALACAWHPTCNGRKVRASVLRLKAAAIADLDGHPDRRLLPENDDRNLLAHFGQADEIDEMTVVVDRVAVELGDPSSTLQ